MSIGLLSLVLLVTAADPAPVVAPPPALSIRAIHPDRQLAELLRLFDGSRAAHPAAALSAWRRATGRHDGLSKAAQAALAALNPEMVPELRVLDGAEVDLWFQGPQRAWYALIPHDDGSLAALAAALALTDGQAQAPRGGAAVDRLGPPGSVLMARTDTGTLALAPNDALLRQALGRLAAPPPRSAEWASSAAGGWTITLRPSAIGPEAPQAVRQSAAALEALGCREARGLVRLADDSLCVDIATSSGPSPAEPGGPIDPAWLEFIPAQGIAAAVCVSLDPAALNRLFLALEAAEKADPARATAGPPRARLGLVALAAGVRLERDLWPLLRGGSAWITTDDHGAVRGAALVLHAADQDSAARIERNVVAPLAARWLDREAVRVDRQDAAVRIAWGCESARPAPERSAASVLRSVWDGAPPHQAGAVWPGRLAARLEDANLAAALNDAAPLIWWHRDQGATTRAVVRWSRLDQGVRRFLDGLPLRFEGE